MSFIVKRDTNFVSVFNPNNGMYIRSGIIKDGKDTGEDPFMASFPELLDVGIMGHCDHGMSGLCMEAGVECYQDGLHADNSNMSLRDFETIVKQCRGKTFQIALGGCGDPDMHERFEEILKLCRDNGIVPNFTTSGLGMTPEKAELCKRYCGAVAVSWYRSSYTLKAIRMLLDAGVKTNIHYVLSTATVLEAYRRLSKNEFPDGINAVVFLLHKPVGLGTAENVIRPDNHIFRSFLNEVRTGTHPFKIGFDSCTVPALIQDLGNIDEMSLDTCEGGRWSAYITADMQMLPCSFDNQEQKWAVDLDTHSIQEAWDSDVFENFRNRFRTACPGCDRRMSCMGGCPICPEVVLCTSGHRHIFPEQVKKQRRRLCFQHH